MARHPLLSGHFFSLTSALVSRKHHSKSYRRPEFSRTLPWTWCATFNTSCFTNIRKRPRPARGRPGLEHSRRRCNVKSAPSGTYVRVGARARGGLEASILATGQHRRCGALRAAAFWASDSSAPTTQWGEFSKNKNRGGGSPALGHDSQWLGHA